MSFVIQGFVNFKIGFTLCLYKGHWKTMLDKVAQKISVQSSRFLGKIRTLPRLFRASKLERSPEVDCMVGQVKKSKLKNFFEKAKKFIDESGVVNYEKNRIGLRNHFRLDFFMGKKQKALLMEIMEHKNLDGSYRFSSSDLVGMSCWKRSGTKKVIDFVNLKDMNRQYLFEYKDLNSLSKMNKNKIEKAKMLVELVPADSETFFKLLEKPIRPDRITYVRKLKQEMGVNLNPLGLSQLLTSEDNIDSLVPIMKSKIESSKGKISNVNCRKCFSEEELPVVNYKYNDNVGWENIRYDESGKIISRENTRIRALRNGDSKSVHKSYSKDSNTVIQYKYPRVEGSPLRLLSASNSCILENETRIIKDKAGKVVRTEYLTHSDVPGVYNEYSVDTSGKVKFLSRAIKGKDGSITVKKDFESLRGTKTHQEYYDDPKGNIIHEYKIVDANNQTLLNSSRVFEVVDENTFVQSYKGKSFEIKVDKYLMNVKDLQTGKTKRINMKKMFYEDTPIAAYISSSVSKSYKNELLHDRELLKKLLSRVSVEDLIMLDKKGYKLSNIDEILKSKVLHDDKTINIGQNDFVFLHELGHTADGKDAVISKDEKLREVFENELRLFRKKFPHQQKHVAYFVDKLSHYNGEEGGLKEVVADANALLKSRVNNDELAIRTHYLQKHFPETIARVYELTNKLTDVNIL